MKPPRNQHPGKQPTVAPMRYWPVLLIFLAVAGLLLWEEHKAHLLGIAPWLLLLALCPLMHVFMHGGHGGGHGERHRQRDRED